MSIERNYTPRLPKPSCSTTLTRVGVRFFRFFPPKSLFDVYLRALFAYTEVEDKARTLIHLELPVQPASWQKLGSSAEYCVQVLHSRL